MNRVRGAAKARRPERLLPARRYNRLGLLAAGMSLAGGLVGGMLSLSASIGADAKRQQISIDQLNVQRNRKLVAEVNTYNATHPGSKAAIFGTPPPSERLTAANVSASRNLATGAGWTAVFSLAAGVPLGLRSLRRQQVLQDRQDQRDANCAASTGHWRDGAELHHLPPRRLAGTNIYMSHRRFPAPFSAGNVTERALTTDDELIQRRTIAGQELLGAAVSLHLTVQA